MGVFIQNKNDFDLMKEKICRGDNLIHGGGVDLEEGENIFIFNDYGYLHKIEKEELIEWLEFRKKKLIELDPELEVQFRRAAYNRYSRVIDLLNGDEPAEWWKDKSSTTFQGTCYIKTRREGKEYELCVD